MKSKLIQKYYLCSANQSKSDNGLMTQPKKGRKLDSPQLSEFIWNCVRIQAYKNPFQTIYLLQNLFNFH